MKRFISLFLLTVILCSTLIPNITAMAAMKDCVFVEDNVVVDEYSCLAPILEYKETDAGGYIVCKYRPDKVNRFLTSESTQELPEAPKTWNTQITVDFKLDNGPWVSELGYLDNASSDIFITEHLFQEPINQSVAFVFADFRQYNPMNDTDNLYSDIIINNDGTYTIDWTKHTIETRFIVNITFGYNGFPLPASPSTILGSINNDNTAPDKEPPQLPSPKITDVIANAENHFISYQLFEDSDINTLLSLNHDIKTLVKYSINNTPSSKEQTINLTHDIYTAIAMIENIKDTDAVDLEIAYYDATTNTTSNWAKYKATVQAENTPEFVMPPLQGENAANVIQMQAEHKCGLCGVCPTQTLSICLWMWGCMSIATIAIIACVVSIIVDLKKKKS